MSGAVLAILSAFSSALNRIFLRRGVIGIADPTIGVLITVPLSLPLFLIILVATGKVQDIFSFPWQSYVWLSVAGILNYYAGRTSNYIAVQLLGANVCSVLVRIAPIIAATIGITFLGEALSGQLTAGILLTIGGVGIASLGLKMAMNGRHGSHLSSRGIYYALLTGFFFGLSPIFIKMGLHDAYSPIAALFISYSAAAVVLSVQLFRQRKREALFSMKGSVFRFFGLVCLFTSAAQVLRFIALSISPVSVVTPLVHTSPVFLLILSFLFNRKLEVFNAAVVAGVVLTVAGAILVAM